MRIEDAARAVAGSFRQRLLWLVVCLLGIGSPAQAQGGLVNGANHTGTIATPGQIDSWTFTAAAGDHISIGIGEVEPTNNFYPWIRLFGPTGTLLAGSYDALAAQLNNVVAPAAGTYTVMVSAVNSVPTGTGGYVLTSVRVPGGLSVSGGDEGGVLINGANHTGRITLGDMDAWTFTASAGDAINVSIAEVEPTSAFYPWIRLISPSGQLLAGSYDALAAQLNNIVAPAAGTYTVLVAPVNSVPQGTGHYVLTSTRVPGSFTVSDGDQGGTLINGANHTGQITLGDVDAWTFTAGAGDSLSISIGEVEPTSSFYPWIRLFGPTGQLLAGSYDAAAAQINHVVAPAAGTYTVLVSAVNSVTHGTGGYVLTSVRVAGSYTVSPGDDGGALANGAVHAGEITLGDLDAWTFTATAGQQINVTIGEVEPTSSFYAWIRLFGPTGQLLAGSYDALAAQINNVTAPATGTYTVVVAPVNSVTAGTGHYRLSAFRSPGTYVVSPGDQGGPMPVNTVQGGEITLGDMDAWTFYANQGNTLVVSIGEVEPTSSFYPWIRLISPTGAVLGGSYGAVSTQMTVVAPATGRYTVLVAPVNSVTQGTGFYNLTVAGAPPQMSDLVVDFGAAGLYMLHNQGGSPSWSRIHGRSPSIVARGQLDGDVRDDLVVVFPGAGTWAWMNDSAWVFVHWADANQLLAVDLNNNGVEDLVISFASYGLWVRSDSGAWTKLHGLPAARLAAGRLDGNVQADLVVSFAGSGLWALMNGSSWTYLRGGEADHLLVGNMDANPIEDVVVNVPGEGVWARFNNAGWIQLHGLNATAMALGNIDGDGLGRKDLIVSFATYGVYALLNVSSWVQLHGVDAPRIATADLDLNGMDDVVLNFPGYGVWAFMNGAAYVPLHWMDADSLTAGYFDAF